LWVFAQSCVPIFLPRQPPVRIQCSIDHQYDGVA
jgi:hypothetical protein